MKGLLNLKCFVLIILSGCSIPLMGQKDSYKFTHLTADDGLSHNQINCFLRDSKGFIWVGTLSGMNRYDGYRFKVFQNTVGDTTSLISNNVQNMAEDAMGRIWVYTYFGTCVYDPDTETFLQNTNRLLNEMSIPDGAILNIHRDSRDKYWFLHQTEGLYLYDPKVKSARRIRHRPGKIINSIGEDRDHNFWIVFNDGLLEKIDGRSYEVVYSNDEFSKRYPRDAFDYVLRIDQDNDLWIFVRNQDRGVFFFDSRTKKLEQYTSKSAVFTMRSDLVKNLVIDDRNIVWVATDHGGLNLINKYDRTVEYLLNDESDINSLSENSINTVYRDYEGVIWAGTFKAGVNYYHENLVKFDLVRHHPGNANSLPHNDINRFVEDKNGDIWIATNGGGLIFYNRRENTYKQYRHDPGNPNSLANDVIVSMHLDSNSILWLGTYYGGLDSFDGKKFTHYRSVLSDSTTLSDNSPWEIMEDSKGNLWIGTLVGGLNKLDRKTGKFTRYGNKDGILTGYVPALLEDSEGTLWVGTGFGINKLPNGATHFDHYLSDGGPGALSNNSIVCFLEDHRGLIWIGTQDGLNVYDPDTKKYTSYRVTDGLPHNNILTLLEDRQGNLWVSTTNGICSIILSDQDGKLTPSFKNYDEMDGLQGRFFNENACMKTRRGELFFGGPNGYNIIYPDQIKLNDKKPPVRLIDFTVFNQPIAVGDEVGNRVLLTKAISATSLITLKHTDNVFSLEFAALSYIHPEKNKYKYKLEGFNTDWLLADNASRRVTYTNLDPGDYTFRVIAANSDGFWNEEGTTLKIVVLPPIWKTIPAFALYLFIIMGALYVARKIAVSRVKMRFKIERERAEAQKVHELDMMKIKFFTNVSHEFRTPLTLIMTPLEKLLKTERYPEEQGHFQLMYRNARRLMNLVNQLLDFRRMEVQEIKLNLSEGDIIGFIRETVSSFSDLSEKKHIHLSFHTVVDYLETMFDQNKVERIMFNLLSNAFKFTPINGSVSVDLSIREVNEEKSLQITVSDTGIGIPANKLDRIFDRFFQSDMPSSMVNQGSGIGLAITREFVRIHGGSIAVHSEPEKGSTFTVVIPLNLIANYSVEPVEPLVLQSGNAVALSEDTENGSDRKKPVILLVEDNEDFRFYLKDNLRQAYRILEANNGKAGLEVALEHIPDLIVSDVMMPEMNGIALCKKVKEDRRTSHIPVILLTARAEEDQKLEGFEVGADDYVTKPFNFEILMARIRNRIQIRKASHQQFQKQIEVKASQLSISSLDEKLIEKAIKVVEENISEAEFSVEDMSRELGMSRVHLYKKLMSLTGKSPIEFIRTLRLQHAAQLLEKSQLNVAEVAYKVGFNNPKYFARYFKEQYNILPSAYAASKKADSNANN